MVPFIANLILMQGQTQNRFSVKDYYHMAETGVLQPDARVELLDGRIIDLPPIGPFHGGVVNRLTRFSIVKISIAKLWREVLIF